MLKHYKRVREDDFGVAQKASQYTAERGGIERQDDSEESELNPLKTLESRHLTARNRKRRHLSETSQITKTERTGFKAFSVSP